MAGLYGHVLQQLSLALTQSERDGHANEEGELDVNGLSAAEIGLLQAYLRGDAQWLSGWHAAARQHALISRRLQDADAMLPPAPHRQQEPLLEQHILECALCGSPVDWPKESGEAICPTCGSQLLRARYRPQGRSRH
ncbi:hypothetical protein [Azomonas macrocytogenes]|uniref:DNA-directed RNA polymerase subunit RPC12/RpoP n=1 Tax=Azomonas macrocytogenes TaxID=69962 RepID=A0A839T064_AZOMA|nr:hypothetical protein [Azomonas macrocytogenes]MBB3102528.1 DNA-directed RNA polymerase subunit RPC12/RpoP [Azomonas macrocytogenes]